VTVHSGNGWVVAAVVLAAGASTRMGRPKLALPVQGVPMIRRVAGAALGSRCRDVIVVFGASAQTYRPLLDGLGARVIDNPRHTEGMSSSLRAGVEAVAPGTTGVVILLGDQPFVTPAIIDGLLALAETSGRRIVAASHSGVAGPPAYFDRTLFHELCNLTGDRGARTVIERHADQCALLPLDAAVTADIDTPEDLTVLSG
jgi:molybdenum cofactor cytidylyltransferase